MLDRTGAMKFRFQNSVGYNIFSKTLRIHSRRSTPDWQRQFAAEFPDYTINSTQIEGHIDWDKDGGDSRIGAPQLSFSAIDEELKKVLASTKEEETPWKLQGPYIGRRLHIQTSPNHSEFIYATVVAYQPPGKTSEDFALWKVIHDDGDVEDRDQREVQECLSRDRKLFLTPMQLKMQACISDKAERKEEMQEDKKQVEVTHQDQNLQTLAKIKTIDEAVIQENSQDLESGASLDKSLHIRGDAIASGSGVTNRSKNALKKRTPHQSLLLSSSSSFSSSADKQAIVLSHTQEEVAVSNKDNSSNILTRSNTHDTRIISKRQVQQELEAESGFQENKIRSMEQEVLSMTSGWNVEMLQVCQ